MKGVGLIAFLPVLLLGHTGCSHVVPRPLPEELRMQLGTVAVVSAHFAPTTRLRTPAKGGAAGVGRGAAKGALMGMAAGALVGADGARVCQGDGCLAAVALIPVGGVIGGLIGAVHGGRTALPVTVVDRAMADVRSAVSGLELQAALRDRMFQAALARTEQRLVLDTERGPHTSHRQADYRALVDQGVDSVVELSVLSLGLTGPWDVDPKLTFSMSARIRLIRAVDGTVLQTRTLEHRSVPRRLTEWAADDARLFREERAQAVESLADSMAAWLFGAGPRFRE